MKTTYLFLIIAVVAGVIVANIALFSVITENAKSTSSSGTTSDILKQAYNPTINPSEFSSTITNPYFPLPVGEKRIYEAHTEEGIERIEILVPGWTKTIMGVETLVFWDRVYVDGELVEDTRDYLAQDAEGNVWYFGENVDNYIGGNFVDHEGAWIGGFNGAKPGIWMPANPTKGDEYRQEYLVGEAEDLGRIDNTGVPITVSVGSFSDCVQIFEWSPLFSATAYKYHCYGIGTVLEEEEEERVELIEIDATGAHCMKLPEIYEAEGVMPGFTATCTEFTYPVIKKNTEEVKTEITEAQAKAIALQRVPGRVTDIGIEKKLGKPVYVVEVDANSGPETDVLIDIETGEVLAVET